MCRKSLRRLGIRMILPEEEEKALEDVSEVVVPLCNWQEAIQIFVQTKGFCGRILCMRRTIEAIVRGSAFSLEQGVNEILKTFCFGLEIVRSLFLFENKE